MGQTNSKAKAAFVARGASKKAVAEDTSKNQSHDVDVVVRKTSNINAKYQIGKTLGRGQFGVTRLAIHRRSGREFAVKSIPKKRLVSQHDVESLKREVTIMHLLAGHPNIIDVKKVYEDQENVHIVMELCTGGELFDHIVNTGNYSESDAAKMVRSMLEVVAELHDFGVVHRDLKPENFLLSSKEPNAQLKLIDFGVSQFCEDEQYLNEMVGSLYYIAPEVLRRKYSFAADIWSIGVIAYIMLCGEPPFHCATNMETFRAILEQDLDFTFEPWPSISDEAKGCIRWMLQRNPDQRGTARDVLHHAWLEKVCGQRKPLGNAVFRRMSEFTQCNRLKRVALKLIASQMPEEETEGLRKMFKAMDTDGSGTLSVAELQEALTKKGASVEELELLTLVEKVDLDDNGEIDYEEFMAANVQMQKLDSDQNIRMAFKHLDRDGNGYITPDEIVHCLMTEQGLTAMEIDDILAEVDADGDGRIDYKEFHAMMREGGRLDHDRGDVPRRPSSRMIGSL
ncbi:unnamed protein product [Ostreobium quekettii]|uniref:non-specific serine/threonine protein kinase n=1 Tax=Ostreobium quekettii TaxID=121088 RepID=A0A8S1JCF0_9CHLO|nr:unnamed protein product [Ostreobium quekettii]|eukprot:evm.model.scf_2751EXC.3 EVM.evm.TU.scf_2751EXC.3   scf_2751EXC:11830-16495(-)